eukprot:m.223034 g.223034  ORF g.223034 m.223034 type:complete len:174 (+) comp15941_c0_seq15:321-842(+)
MHFKGADKRDASGELTASKERFPMGMQSLAATLHSRGLKLGLYTSAGNATCNSGGRPYKIPGSEGHYQQDADTFARWGIDFVKIDWCGDVKKIWPDGLPVMKKRYIEFSHAFNKSSPLRPIFIDGVAAFLGLRDETPEYYNGWRSFSDHHDIWSGEAGTVSLSIWFLNLFICA